MSEQPGPPELDLVTGRPYSSGFLAARAFAMEAQQAAAALTSRRLDGDQTVTREIEDEAEREAFRLAAVAHGILEADRETIRSDSRRRAVEEAIAEPFEAALQAAVDVLRARGPMTGAEIEAMRIPGLSHNVLRPVLREGVERGIVQKDRSGRRVIWSAI